VGQANPKKRWFDRGSQMKGAPNKKPVLSKPKTPKFFGGEKALCKVWANQS